MKMHYNYILDKVVIDIFDGKDILEEISNVAKNITEKVANEDVKNLQNRVHLKPSVMLILIIARIFT